MSKGSIYPDTARCRSNGCDWVAIGEGLCSFHYVHREFVRDAEI